MNAASVWKRLLMNENLLLWYLVGILFAKNAHQKCLDNFVQLADETVHTVLLYMVFTNEN